jgi:hypothetical protein
LERTVVDDRTSEITTRIGNILLDILPDHASSITLHGEALSDWAEAQVEFETANGTEYFDFDNEPADAVGDLGFALIDLHKAMAESGQEPFYGATVTVHRDGQFNVDFSYERPAHLDE